MRIGKVKGLIKSYIKAGVNWPVFLFGGPGVGKTAICREIASEVFGSGEDWPKGNFLPISLVYHEAPDLIGVPVTVNGRVEWLPLIEMPSEGKGIILFDELNKASDDAVKASYQWLFDRKVGNRKLGKDWFVVAAGNRMGDRCQVLELPAALNNRCLIYGVETNLDDWKSWALGNGIAPEVVAFHNYTSGTKLYCFDPEKYAPEDSFPSPRSWEAASDLLKANIVDVGAIGGAVGEGMATEFVSYLRTRNEMPDIGAILSGKSDEIPRRPDVLHLVCSILVARAKRKPKLTKRLVEYATLLPPEFAVLLVMDAMKADLPIKSETREFKRFAKRYGRLILTNEELKRIRTR